MHYLANSDGLPSSYTENAKVEVAQGEHLTIFSLEIHLLYWIGSHERPVDKAEGKAVHVAVVAKNFPCDGLLVGDMAAHSRQAHPRRQVGVTLIKEAQGSIPS